MQIYNNNLSFSVNTSDNLIADMKVIAQKQPIGASAGWKFGMEQHSRIRGIFCHKNFSDIAAFNERGEQTDIVHHDIAVLLLETPIRLWKGLYETIAMFNANGPYGEHLYVNNTIEDCRIVGWGYVNGKHAFKTVMILCNFTKLGLIHLLLLSKFYAGSNNSLANATSLNELHVQLWHPKYCAQYFPEIFDSQTMLCFSDHYNQEGSACTVRNLMAFF